MFKVFLIASLMVVAVPTLYAQSCDNAISKSTPTAQFVDNHNGSILDSKTGLIWMRCSIGQIWQDGSCAGVPESLTWQQALERSEDYKGWRVPNIKELRSIVEYSCAQPAINLAVFPTTSAAAISGRVWTSTPNANRASDAWLMHYSFGQDLALAKINLASVRLVR